LATPALTLPALVALTGGIVLLYQAGSFLLLGTLGLSRVGLLLPGPLLVVLPLLLVLRAAGRPAGPALGIRPAGAEVLLAAVVGVVAAVPPVLAVTSRIVPAPEPVQEFFTRLLRAGSPGELALTIVAAAIVPAVTEELLFRGFLQPLLVQNFRDKGGILLTSLAFAALHGLGAFLPIFALSLLLGGIMLRTQRLVACWAVHALHNGLTLALLLASEEVRAALPRSAASLSFLLTSS
jgi:membrane protease YdiL (CAAX protease family)